MISSRVAKSTWLVVAATVIAGIGAPPVMAASPSAGWSVSSLAEPTNFSPTHTALCSPLKTAEKDNCDRYVLFVRNAGSRATNGPTVISDAIPAGVTAVGIEGNELEPGSVPHKVECKLTPVQCNYEAAVPAGGIFVVVINVEVAAATGIAPANVAAVSGGEAPNASTNASPTPIGPTPLPFGLDTFSFETDGVDGRVDSQAGDHPNSVTATLHLTGKQNTTLGSGGVLPVEQLKDVAVDLPMGLIGNPQAGPTCSLADLNQGGGETLCPPNSEVGTLSFEGQGAYRTSNVVLDETSGIFNMTPEGGHPAEFGFNYLGHTLVMYANAIPTSSGYVLRVMVPGVPRVIDLNGATLTFFGDPGIQNGSGSSPNAFLTNPMNCAAGQPLRARIVVDSWEKPEQWVEANATAYERGPAEPVGGCNMLEFQPTLAFQPETAQADEPSGYAVDLKVPQAPNFSPDLATPELRSARVTLPAGVSVSPSAADGLAACAAEGALGINLTATVPLENQKPGSPLSVPEGGHCPQASIIGTVEITTPLLSLPLQGHLFLAQPKCGGEGQPECTEASSTNGELYGLYLEAEGSGAVIKLKGTVSANPTTGQLTATFAENPQLPFSELKVQLKGGSRAPLANPQTCGPFTTSTDLTPWSAPVTPDATPSSSFSITGCGGSMPFTPSFSAGVLAANAASSSPFTLTFSRHDGEQDFSAISVNTPPGLVGMLSQLPLCEEPRAAQGTCSESSRIGTTTVAAGAGSHPFWLSGKVYLTGPYNGAPFGLSVVVPAKAGPFNLGNVIVRSAINVDPKTSALTVTSGPLPQIKDGVPFRLKTVNVTIDRPGFMLNPTNCESQSISGTIAAAQGARASVASPFAVSGCANLPFKPSFKVSTQAKTSKANGASLDVKVSQKPGESNIKKVDVQLPLALPSRLTTLQKACTAAQFESNPAACPEGSFVGVATARSPILRESLTGPAILVSHGAQAFPDLVVVLQVDERGGHIQIDLTGHTSIKKGITFSQFDSVPDAPISSFELSLPMGPHSALAAFGDLCTQSLIMPTTITGQNGAVVHQNTHIGVTSCGQRISISKEKLTGNSVSVTVSTTAQGRVIITGAGLRRTSKTLGVGSHTIKVPLNATGRSARGKHRKIKINASLRVGKNTVVAKTASLKL